MTVRIVLDLSDDEKRIIDLIRVQGETYVDTIKRIINNYFEYQLVKEAVDKLYDKLGVNEKENRKNDGDEKQVSKEKAQVKIPVKTGNPVDADKLAEFKKNLESRWR
ncbi:TVG0634229 [Thermoplasma volcanium GSS1]|uniref:TVG0634229 protein n=1 Tax=Thermoplasma volcanium (strain ATCC 51530 / DSM 4299 / JCM 9571 / NBRC 15438 / GSS1) TaxID=273116 RepID=Q97B18_THEVO|nr:hypothetical protein [Thermoplasma volcanium]BAB59783.1 TVG0634229 [Thermoplasma volcanium GSS1]